MADRKNSLKIQAIGLIVGLTLEYLLGMATNLFVHFPEGVHEGLAWQFAWTQIPLALHIILGLLLFIGSVVLTIRAARAKDRVWIKASGLGLVAILVAVFGGEAFVTAQKEAYSLLMSVSFIVAYLAYFWGIYKSKS